MFRIASLVALLGVAAGAVQAQTPGENLFVMIPHGFVLGNRDAGPLGSIEEFHPERQNLQNWTELVTLGGFPGSAGQSPEQFIAEMRRSAEAACPGATIGAPQSVNVGDYPAARIVVNCPASPRNGQAESFIALAISGNDEMHVVQYAWTRFPSRDDLLLAEAFFDAVLVCDTRLAEAPCPAFEVATDPGK